MAEPKKKRKKHPLRRIKRAVSSRLGVVVFGLLSIALATSIAILLALPSNIIGNPGQFSDPAHIALRDKTIREGFDDEKAFNGMVGVCKSTRVTIGEMEYTYSVSPAQNASHFYEISTSPLVDEKHRARIAFGDEDVLTTDESIASGAIFASLIEILNADGSYLTTPEGKMVFINYIGRVDTKLNERRLSELENQKDSGITDEEFQVIYDNSIAAKDQLLHDLPAVFQALGTDRFEEILQGSVYAHHRLNVSLGLPGIAVLLSIFAGPVICAFIVGWIHLRMADKRHRLLSRGELDMNRRAEIEAFDPLGPEEESEEETEGDVREETPPQEEEKELPPPRNNAFERFIETTKIRPVFGEWFFRALGLFLVAVGTVLVYYASLAAVGLYGPGGEAFGAGVEYFEAIAQAGRFILVIALIGIISETSHNLKLSSIFFFSLAFTYYLVISSVLMLLDFSMPISFGGESLSNTLSVALPGNVFLGIGLFAFIGFFLFSNPPEWFINRKVFRLLSLIPLTVAILSIVLSAIFRAEVLRPNYWIKNLIFIRDFDAVFIGVSYEFSVFFFRRYVARKYGEDNVERELTFRSIQFMKNISLCGLILLFTVFFYSIPQSWKASLSLPTHTFIYCLIPLFLFYKPAGKNHKGKLDILYYALYILAMLLPKILSTFS